MCGLCSTDSPLITDAEVHAPFQMSVCVCGCVCVCGGCVGCVVCVGWWWVSVCYSGVVSVVCVVCVVCVCVWCVCVCIHAERSSPGLRQSLPKMSSSG